MLLNSTRTISLVSGKIAQKITWKTNLLSWNLECFGCRLVFHDTPIVHFEDQIIRKELGE